MGCIASILEGRVEEIFEGFGNVSRHGNIDILLVTILVNGQSTVVLTSKVHVDFVIFLNSV